MEEKCVVLFSGGLDSRLALKIMQERGFKVIALFFNLPFGTGCCNSGCAFNFSQLHDIKLEIFDCTKGELLQEYLNIIKKPKYGRGAGINPCIDCRIFMFKKAKEFADEKGIKFIVTGEVIGQRPMSQREKQIDIIEKGSGLQERIIRPLIDLGISGRSRKSQIELANKFKINYPDPAGGCLLCEKQLKKRLKYLLSRGLDEKEIKLVGIGRHFLINDSWVVIGRNENENKIINSFKKAIIPDFLGPSALVLGEVKGDIMDEVNSLIKAYSKKGSLEERKIFEKYKM